MPAWDTTTPGLEHSAYPDVFMMLENLGPLITALKEEFMK